MKAILREEQGHGNWLKWLDREFGWSEATAKRFISVHELSLKSLKLSDLELPVSALYLLAAPSIPESACDAVLDLAANGETLTHAQVKQMIAEAKESTASDYEARQGPRGWAAWRVIPARGVSQYSGYAGEARSVLKSSARGRGRAARRHVGAPAGQGSP